MFRVSGVFAAQSVQWRFASTLLLHVCVYNGSLCTREVWFTPRMCTLHTLVESEVSQKCVISIHPSSMHSYAYAQLSLWPSFVVMVDFKS